MMERFICFGVGLGKKRGNGRVENIVIRRFERRYDPDNTKKELIDDTETKVFILTEFFEELFLSRRKG